jgi:hypothetical protein
MIATAFMALAAWLVLKAMKPLPISPRLDILRLVAVVPSAAIVYALAAKLLKAQMLSLVTGTRQK